MLIKLVTETLTENSTIGKFIIDGAFECYTLEDKDRGLYSYMPMAQIQSTKVKGRTAIPYGTYNVSITFSNRFQKMMPLITPVVGFEGIRIHSGNTASDTEGCILLGQHKGLDIVTDSRKAFDIFFRKLHDAIDKGDTVTLLKVHL